jgi:hypothetical protein
MLERKLAEQGIVLSKNAFRKLLDATFDRGDRNMVSERWRFWKRRSQSVSIVFTDADTQEALRIARQVLDDLPNIFAGASNEIATIIRNEMERHWQKNLRRARRDRMNFAALVGDRWQHVLDYMHAHILMSQEFGTQVNSELRAGQVDPPAKIDALTRLQARACQVSEETMTLLSHGYPEGAMARWRTLHEIVVVMSFLADGDEDLAQRYLRHVAIQSRDGARKYRAACERLDVQPPSDDEQAEVDAECLALEERYGKSYRRQYGWAAARLNKQQPTFADIERAVGIDHLRPYYWHASHRVHPNAHGILQRLGLVEEHVLLAGPSDSGLEDPAQLTVISLGQANATLLQLSPTADNIIATKVMQLLLHELQNHLKEPSSDSIKSQR